MINLLKNIHKPGPAKFRRVKKSLLILADGAALWLLGFGFKDNAPVILVCRIGVSTLLNSLEALLGYKASKNDDN